MYNFAKYRFIQFITDFFLEFFKLKFLIYLYVKSSDRSVSNFRDELRQIFWKFRKTTFFGKQSYSKKFAEIRGKLKKTEIAEESYALRT